MAMRLLFCMMLLCFVATRNFAQDSVVVDDKIFLQTEVQAGFPGGIPSWTKYLQKSLNANVPVKNGAPAGRYSVRVQFVIDKDGSVTDIKPLTNLGYGMEAEVIRIIEKSGKWQPAVQRGRKVKAFHIQPVVFMVEDDNLEIISDAGMYLLVAGKNNTININAGKLKSTDLQVSLSNGTITLNDNGSFSVLVEQPGRTILTVYNKKKNKLLGEVSFEVLKR